MDASATTAPPERGVLLRIAPFTLIIFLVYLTVGMPLAALPLQVHDVLGFDNLTVGITIGLQSLVTILTRQFAGSLCDRRGAKFGVILGGGVSVLASAIYLASTATPFGPMTSLALLLAARVISGLAESLVMTGALAWGIGAVGPKNTGKVMVWVGIGLYTAIAVGAPIGIALMKPQSVAGGFAAVSLGMIAISALATAVTSFIPAVAPAGGERLPFTEVIGRIAPFGAGLALATLAFGAIGTFAALDFQDRGWPGAGFALTGYGAAYVLTRFCFGGWPDRFGGGRVAAWSLFVECIGQLMLWLAPHPAVAFRRDHLYRYRQRAGLPVVRYRSGQARAARQPRRRARRLCRVLRCRLRPRRTNNRTDRRRLRLSFRLCPRRTRRCRRHSGGATFARRRSRTVKLIATARRHNTRLTISDRARKKNRRAHKKLLHRCGQRAYVALAQFRTCLWPRAGWWASGQEAGQPPGANAKSRRVSAA